MKNTKSMAGMLLAAAVLAVVTLPTEAIAKKDPFGYAANQAAMNMWIQQQQQRGAGYNGYYANQYNNQNSYNNTFRTYGSYNSYNPYANNLYGNNLYTNPGNNNIYRRSGVGSLLQQLF